ncbi:class I SAM-dependent methyltransferase [Tundrisphaera lichenicola]|uniref:class I SAM-dependent methyltransferase n=1 Tax=Tundrisphaera lichenicola TaxID=2029860 RepID=UPI003EBF45EF
MIGDLPILEGDQVLDLACGDGAYSGWLLDRVGTTGSILALDLLMAYLKKARIGLKQVDGCNRSRFVAASIDRLPFADGRFDFVWCAQSLFSLPEPVEALRSMARVVRPGGHLAVLENDTMHQVLLPWPVDLELAIRSAEWDDFREDSENPRKFYVGRRLSKLFGEAGLGDIRRRTYATDRQSPLSQSERTFLLEYLKDLRERVLPRLGSKFRKQMDTLTDPGSRNYLPDQPDLAMTVIDHVVWGKLKA